MTKYIGNDCRLFLAQYDLSIGGQEITVAAEVPAYDATTVNDTSEQSIMGAVSKFLFEWSGLYDNDATGSYPGLKTLVGTDTAQIITVQLGNTIGDEAVIGQVKVINIRPGARFKELLSLGGDFAGQAAPDWGKLQYPKTTITVTTAGAGLDGSALSANGGVWSYHVIAFSAAGGNARWQLNFQHDSDSGFGTVTAKDGPVNITAVGAARRSMSGNIERYTRLQAERDATSGSLTVVCAFKRT